MKLKDQVAVVTGAGRGIGKAVALELAAEGAEVILVARSQDQLEAVAEEIRQNGGQARVCPTDVSDAESVAALAKEAGSVQILVNNAGITRDTLLLRMKESDWDEVLNVNLKSAYLLTKAFSKGMLKQRSGRIINITSISAYAVSTNRADYCMAKSAMRTMTLLFADRLADEGIRVYEVCPGVISSDMTAPVRDKYDRLIAEGLTPIRRWGQPEDVGRAVVALAGDAFPFSTGDCINVDGGFHIRRL